MASYSVILVWSGPSCTNMPPVISRIGWLSTISASLGTSRLRAISAWAPNIVARARAQFANDVLVAAMVATTAPVATVVAKSKPDILRTSEAR